MHIGNGDLEYLIWEKNSIVYRELRPTASKPPNAPDTVAAEKKIAARMPNSERLYQLHNVFVSEY